MPLTNLVRDSIVQDRDLPLRVTAHTPVSVPRRLGRARYPRHDPVAPIRQGGNGFDHPSGPFRRRTGTHDQLRRRSFEALRLAYRVVVLCTGDMGFGARKPMTWRSGCRARTMAPALSRNFQLFQHGRFPGPPHEGRFRSEGAKRTEFVHTLNGSGFGGRALLGGGFGNYQTADGGSISPRPCALIWAVRRGSTRISEVI